MPLFRIVSGAISSELAFFTLTSILLPDETSRRLRRRVSFPSRPDVADGLYASLFCPFAPCRIQLPCDTRAFQYDVRPLASSTVGRFVLSYRTRAISS